MKNIMKTLAVVTSMSLATSSFACSIDGSRKNGGFVPENDLRIPVGHNKAIRTGLTEEKFNAVIDKVEGIYAPIISSMGARLNVERNWSDATVNAYASQSGKNYKVAMFGGLARHETITEDGFALVVCHEIGHHIGGAPKKGQPQTGGGGGGWWGGTSSSSITSWASNEGQADYFANLKCLRRVFLNDDNAKIVKGLNAPKSLVDACSQANKGNKADKEICIRGGMAGMSVSRLFMALRNSTSEPKFETPDSKVVAKTDDNHPAYQCRLDTYFQGSLCEIDMNTDVSQEDETVGTCHKLNGQNSGIRPLCWHKPKTSFTAL
ncbi:MAG: hypothetical protein ACOVP4_10130 [Bacteriovoracaceae bacterium]|jgi:hypothetical protein